jgi:hypothetical protein
LPQPRAFRARLDSARLRALGFFAQYNNIFCIAKN